jgi:hypothetical protein
MMQSSRLASYRLKFLIWPRDYSSQAIIFSFFLVGFISVIFNQHMMNPLVLALGLLIILFFFLGLNYYISAWIKIDSRKFYRKLFWHSVLYRLIFVGILYLLTSWLDPNNFPFEIGAADSWIYHRVGIKVAEGIRSGQVFDILENSLRNYTDYGFPLYNGIIYYIFGPHSFFIRLFNVLWGSLTVVLISKISRNVFGDLSGRVAGVITMLMPALLWYTGIHLKETLMIFIITVVLYTATRIAQEGKLKLMSLGMMVLLILTLFYFRLFLAVFVFLCVSLYFLFMFSKGRMNKGVIIGILIVFLLVMVNLIGRLGFKEDVFTTLLDGQDRFMYELTYGSQERSFTFEKTFVAPFIIAGSPVTPFPTLLDLDERQLAIYSKFHNELTRNIMYFFAFLGIYFAVTRSFKNSSLILLFTLGYIFILMVSAVSFQDRYQLPSLPFMIVFMSAGLVHVKKPLKGKWPVYLVFIFLAIFAWNFFKLTIRGLF